MNDDKTLVEAPNGVTPQCALVMPMEGNPEILFVPRTIIRAFADQPRTQFDPTGLDSLGDSMLEHGQLIPALAKRLNPPIGQYQFELIDGERRWQASELKKITHFMIMLVEGDILPDEQFIKSVVANFFRESLGLMDLARAIDRFDKIGMSMTQIGKLMGNKSVTWAFQHHSLMRLCPEVQKLLGPPTPEKEQLSFQNALQLVDEDPDQQLRMAIQISSQGFNQKRARHLILKAVMGTGNIGKKARKEFHILARFVRNTSEEIETTLDHEQAVFKQVIEAAKPEELKKMLEHLDDLVSGFESLAEEVREAAGLKKPKKSKF